MVIVADGEGDVDGVARQKRRLLQAFGHVPSEGVKDSSQFPVPSSQFYAAGLGLLAATDPGAIRMAARSGEDRYCREFFFAGIFSGERLGRELMAIVFSRFQLELDVFIFQNLGWDDQTHAAGRERGLVISRSVRFEQLQHLIKPWADLIQIQFCLQIEHWIEIRRSQNWIWMRSAQGFI